jgi:glycogenin glucosyltransferase
MSTFLKTIETGRWSMDRIARVPPVLAIAFAIYQVISLHRHPPRPPPPLDGRYAFATVVTPAFAMGAVVLGHTLSVHHGDRYERICLVSVDLNATWRAVLSQWWTLISPPEYRPMVHFRRSWTKFRLWNMTEYRKIIYLDTDTFVLQPIDELFDYPQLSCACDPNPPQICNTGVIVIEPREGLFAEMDQLARVEAVRIGVGDQSSINAFFRGFTPLPTKYNAARTIEPGLGDLMNRGVLKVIHFVCKKPWKCGREGVEYCGCGYPELNQLWWDTWDKACAGKKCLESWEEHKATKRPTKSPTS